MRAQGLRPSPPEAPPENRRRLKLHEGIGLPLNLPSIGCGKFLDEIVEVRFDQL